MSFLKRVSDIIVDELIKLGIKQVFMVTGGGAMHLNDAFGKRRDDLNILFNHHEQASAIAAESYCRLGGKPAVVNVTTGPGGINALNGVYGAYVDSISMIVISGQIKRQTMASNYPINLRQLGDQEVDIISIVKPIVKYAIELQDPMRVLEVIDKAVFIAQSGRPGPVWIDVPMDIQGAIIEENSLQHWDPSLSGALLALRGDTGLTSNTLNDFTIEPINILRKKAETLIAKLKHSKQPVLLGGSGVHISGCEKEFNMLATTLNIPTVAGWNAYDLVPNSHPCYVGRPGTIGDRAGNFAVQNSDFLLVLGCRLNIRQISYNWESFAPSAWKAQVDIDLAELTKPTLTNDLIVQADLRIFLPILLEMLASYKTSVEHSKYLSWCKERVYKYPVLQPHHKKAGLVNPYNFMEQLFSMLSPNDVVVAANATAAVVSGQIGEQKEGLRMYSNSGDASMGYDLPAAIGAAVTGKAKRVICLAGDGSIMMNLQELQTIINYKIPIIIFLLNNNGYLSIRMTQSNHFPQNKLGTDPSNGVSFPDYLHLAETFGFRVGKIKDNIGLGASILEAISQDAPTFYEIILDPQQGFEPKLASRILSDGTMTSPALDDMAPFLSQEELNNNRLR